MLYLNKTRIVASKPMKVASGVTIADEGMPLVVANENGNAVVKPATGSGAEVFAGVAAFERRTPATLAQVKRFPGTGAIQTIQIPNYVNGTARMTINGAALNGGTPEASITSGGLLTIIAGVTSAQVIEIAYTYTPTVQEAERLVGSIFQATAVAAGAHCGAVYQGEIYTSCFDTSVAWLAGTALKLGAGVFTNTGAGATVPGAFVSHAPTESEPYLGIDIR